MYSWPPDLVWKITILAIGRQKFNEFCSCIALHLGSLLVRFLDAPDQPILPFISAMVMKIDPMVSGVPTEM